jgi:hypothetical protein
MRSFIDNTVPGFPNEIGSLVNLCEGIIEKRCNSPDCILFSGTAKIPGREKGQSPNFA